MQVREPTIKNFRGLRDFKWQPGGAIACLVGRGDTGKSTILDAIEAALSSRHTSFSDLDFLNGSVTNNIQITVTVGELSPDLLNEKRFGTYVRGWTTRGHADRFAALVRDRDHLLEYTLALLWIRYRLELLAHAERTAHSRPIPPNSPAGHETSECGGVEVAAGHGLRAEARSRGGESRRTV